MSMQVNSCVLKSTKCCEVHRRNVSAGDNSVLANPAHIYSQLSSPLPTSTLEPEKS